MAWLVVKVKGQERAFEIDEDRVFIGSGDSVLLRIPREGVIDKHCQIIRSGQDYEIVDLGSEAGTTVNGERIDRAPLHHGDVIGVGRIAVRFRTKLAPAAPPPKKPVSRAAPPPAGTRGRRRGSPAAGENAALVRRRLRERRGIPTPYLIAVLAISVVLSAFVIFHFATKQTLNIESAIQRANAAMDVNDTDAAAAILKRVLENIDENHHHYKYVSNLYKQASTQETNLALGRRQADMASVYENNIKRFYHETVMSDDEQFKDDPSTARYFVEYRLKPFLEEYPESPHRGTVQMWIDQLKLRYDESDPYPESWWDHEIISSMEERLEHYGVSYEVLNSFLQKNPDAKAAATCRQELENCLRRAQKTGWAYYDHRLQMAMNATPSPQFSRALGWLHKAWENLRQIPELRREIEQRVGELKQLAAKHNVKIDVSQYPF